MIETRGSERLLSPSGKEQRAEYSSEKLFNHEFIVSQSRKPRRIIRRICKTAEESEHNN